MLKWLVSIDVSVAGESASHRDELLAAERERVAEQASAGMLQRLRIPGRWESWSVWEVEDAASLHAALSSLPLWPWMSVRVEPLARHDLDPIEGVAS